MGLNLRFPPLEANVLKVNSQSVSAITGWLCHGLKRHYEPELQRLVSTGSIKNIVFHQI